MANLSLKSLNQMKGINQMANKKFIVFWQMGNRIGSIEFTNSNWIEVQSLFTFNVIQTDDSGTIHLELLGKANSNVIKLSDLIIQSLN